MDALDKKASASPEETEMIKKKKWTNRERVLVFCSRGASYRDRHLMKDFCTLMPHSKTESKLDKNAKLSVVNELCEMKNCSKCVYFECRKKKDLYLWLSNAPSGPSVKFLVHNIHTMGELRLSGNCLRGSRPLLCFDQDFYNSPHLQILKELFIQTFESPRFHPRSQPFVDHIFNWSLTPDGRIWFRNYQIVEENGQLEEIGPRMVLEIIKIFEGSFGGPVLFESADYVSPNAIRALMKKKGADRYANRLEQKMSMERRRRMEAETVKTDPLDDVFQVPTPDSDEDDQLPPAVKKLRRAIQTKKRKKKSNNKTS